MKADRVCIEASSHGVLILATWERREDRDVPAVAATLDAIAQELRLFLDKACRVLRPPSVQRAGQDLLATIHITCPIRLEREVRAVAGRAARSLI